MEAQVTRLLREGYQPVTFTQAATSAGRGAKRLAITFDDGFASVDELARPILDRLGAPATLFAVTDFARGGRPLCWPGIDHWQGGSHDEELRSVDWAALRRLGDGGWEIGSHTCDHPRLTQLGDEDLRRQLEQSRHACASELGRPCTSIAYPYGDTDARVVAAAAAAGYAAGAALSARWGPSEPLCVPRVGVYHSDDPRRFAVKTSRVVRGLRGALEPRLGGRSARWARRMLAR